MASFAKDIAELADLLQLGEKIWLLGYSFGGAYTWAAVYYIPERIAGIAMWAPVGYYWWKDISEADRSVAFGPKGSQRLFSILRKLPPWFLHLYARHACLGGVGRKHVQEIRKKLLPLDIHYIKKPKVYEVMIRDNLESAKQMYFGLGCDLCLITRDWGFEITDLPRVYQGPLHIWNGDQDLLVNIDLQRCIKNWSV